MRAQQSGKWAAKRQTVFYGQPIEQPTWLNRRISNQLLRAVLPYSCTAASGLQCRTVVICTRRSPFATHDSPCTILQQEYAPAFQPEADMHLIHADSSLRCDTYLY